MFNAYDAATRYELDAWVHLVRRCGALVKERAHQTSVLSWHAVHAVTVLACFALLLFAGRLFV